MKNAGQHRNEARSEERQNGGGRISLPPLMIMIGLVIAPTLAGARWEVDFVWAGGFALGISALTFLTYAYDKRQARAEAWRLPETLLHTLELLGGWPGAFLAQRWLRHKCVKVGYQVVFWLIVLAYQFLAIDSLLGWKLCRAVLSK